jgi:hypothetical protein
MTRTVSAVLYRCLALLVCASSIVWGGCAGSLPFQKKPLTLVWYGLARQSVFANTTYVPLVDEVTLATNDGIQLFVSVSPEAYIYAFHQTTGGEFAVLWPSAERRFDARLQDGRVQTIPSRGRVYPLPLARGTEAVYLIAARKPAADVQQLMREMRWLFASAQALEAGVPGSDIRRDAPDGVEWGLNTRSPARIDVVDHYIRIGTTVRNIGERRVAGEQIVSTAEGGTYSVRAEQLTGNDVVARVVRIHRVVSH